MRNVYEYRRLPFCDPKDVCKALMEYEDMGYEIFQLELQPNGTEYLLYIRKPSIVVGATYIILEDTGKMFHKGDYFKGLPDNILEHCRSGVKIEFALKWKGLIEMVKEDKL